MCGTSPVDEAAAIDRKTETFNLRVSRGLKDLLRLASTREHRTLGNMVEFLVREHCEQHQIAAQTHWRPRLPHCKVGVGLPPT
jgi:hypothetical protein